MINDAGKHGVNIRGQNWAIASGRLARQLLMRPRAACGRAIVYASRSGRYCALAPLAGRGQEGGSIIAGWVRGPPACSAQAEGPLTRPLAWQRSVALSPQ